MANMSNYLENKVVDHLFRGISYTMPGTLAIALVTTLPDDTSTGATLAEPSGGSYARVVIGPGAADWLSTNGSTIGPSTGTSGTTSNAADITFPTATASWGTIVGIAICDSLTVGTGEVLFWGALTNSQAVGISDIFKFTANQLSVQIN